MATCNGFLTCNLLTTVVRVLIYVRAQHGPNSARAITILQRSFHLIHLMHHNKRLCHLRKESRERCPRSPSNILQHHGQDIEDDTRHGQCPRPR
jgi:hypothetical protein